MSRNIDYEGPGVIKITINSGARFLCSFLFFLPLHVVRESGRVLVSKQKRGNRRNRALHQMDGSAFHHLKPSPSLPDPSLLFLNAPPLSELHSTLGRSNVGPSPPQRLLASAAQ